MAQKRSVYTSFIILDAQSVKNTDPAESSGYDGGKKVSGIKRHLAVDINGLPMAVHVTTANVSERDGANALLALNKSQFDLVQRVMADGGYTGNNFAQSVQAMINAEVIIAKQRNGPIGTVELFFKSECTLFLNLDKYHTDDAMPPQAPPPM